MERAEPRAAPTGHPLFEEGLRLHNGGEFYEAHEAWEQIWVNETDDAWRLFVQGLIQVTSAFHKLFFQREPRGAARLLERGLEKLDRYPPDYLGVDLGPFRDGARAFISRMTVLEAKSPALDALDRASVPRLRRLA
jgi:predicted metal-dependent hydrolase